MGKPFFAILAVCLLTACAGTDRVSRSWHGRTVGDLVAAWGAASDIHDQDDGGKLVVYRFTEGLLPVYGGSDRKPLVRGHCVVSFVADTKGVVVGSSEEGTIGGCVLNLRGRPLGS